MGKTIDLNESNFDKEVLESDKLVLVDFWATWCEPCKATEPMVDDIARHYEGKIKVGKVDVGAETMIANRYAVRGVPTFLLFKNGEVVNQITSGTLKREEFEQIIKQYMK